MRDSQSAYPGRYSLEYRLSAAAEPGHLLVCNRFDIVSMTRDARIDAPSVDRLVAAFVKVRQRLSTRPPRLGYQREANRASDSDIVLVEAAKKRGNEGGPADAGATDVLPSFFASAIGMQSHDSAVRADRLKRDVHPLRGLRPR